MQVTSEPDLTLMLQQLSSGRPEVLDELFPLVDWCAEGRLKPLLVDCHVSEPVPITALMPPGRQHLPRVRAFIDFLVEHAPEPVRPM